MIRQSPGSHRLSRVSLLALVVLSLPVAPAVAQTASGGPMLLGLESDRPAPVVAPASAPAPAPQQDGQVSLAMYGGYGLYERQEITLSPASGGASVRVMRKAYGGQPVTVEGAISNQEFAALWKTLEAHKVLRLADNTRLRGQVRDLYTFEIAATRGGKSNRFQVFGPHLLGDPSFDKSALSRMPSFIRSLFPGDDTHYQAVVAAIMAIGDRIAKARLAQSTP